MSHRHASVLLVGAAGHAELREERVRYARQMLAAGLVSGTSGNLSARTSDGASCLVTPSGVVYESMLGADLVEMGLDGSIRSGRLKPSVDTPIHLAIYRGRADVGAVVHTHSPFATAFSAVGAPIP